MDNQDRRMVPYGIDLNSIPKENLDSKALIPVSDALPLATIPPKPHSYGQSYFTQSVLAAPPQPLLLEDAPPKGPVIKLPAGTKILPLKHNETLVGGRSTRVVRSSAPSIALESAPTSKESMLIQAKSSSSRRRTLLNTPLLLPKLHTSVVRR
jgi:hypothetical protein